MLTVPNRHTLARSLLATAIFFALLAWATQRAAAQDAPTPAPSATPAATEATQPPAAPAAPAAETPAAPEPLFKEYKGVTLGMSAAEVRSKLGQPREKDKTQDIFIFSDAERARVYYDTDGKANAVIVTYIGKSATAPGPKEVLGAEVEPGAGGALYKMVTYPAAGYWVAYTRTAGDEPMTMITMQRAPGAKP